MSETDKKLTESWYDQEHYPSSEVYTATILVGSIATDIINILDMHRKRKIEKINPFQQDLLNSGFQKFEESVAVLQEAGMLDESNKTYKRTKIDAEKSIFYVIDWMSRLEKTGLISYDEIQEKAPTLYRMMQEPEKHPFPEQKSTMGQKVKAWLLARGIKNG